MQPRELCATAAARAAPFCAAQARQAGRRRRRVSAAAFFADHPTFLLSAERSGGVEEWPAFGQLCSFCVAVVLRLLEYMSDALCRSSPQLYLYNGNARKASGLLSKCFSRCVARDCFSFGQPPISLAVHYEIAFVSNPARPPVLSSDYLPLAFSSHCFPGDPLLPSPDFWQNGDAFLCRRRLW